MREELIRVLKAKLEEVNRRIDSLVELNKKIDTENEELDYASNILKEFKDGDEYNILNFDKLSKEDFDKVLNIVDNDSDKVFNSSECSYEGLIYLINGIKNGVSVNLTDEQKNSIEYLVRGIAKKEEEYRAIIDGLTLAKARYGEVDVESLTVEKSAYNEIINDFTDRKLIKDIDRVSAAFDYSGLSQNEIVALLSYILSYNAEVYEQGSNGEQSFFDVNNLAKNDIEESKITNINTPKEVNDKITFKPIDVEKYRKLNNSETKEVEENNETVSFDESKEEYNVSFDNEKENVAHEENFTNSVDEDKTFDEIQTVNVEEKKDDVFEYNPFTSDLNSDISFESEKEDSFDNENVIENKGVEFDNIQDNKQELNEENVQSVTYDESKIDADFNDVVVDNSDYEEEKTSQRELQRLFAEFDLKNVEIDESLLNGSAEVYRTVLDTLKKNNLLTTLAGNQKLFIDVVTSSSCENIESILKIIKEDLSVDEDDYKVTLKIVLNTLPIIFIKENGYLDNFVKNVSFFKEIGINLINLFDFSKEVFIVENERIVENYNIVKQYGIEIDYKNAKYMLVLSNIAERIDYYVESVYEDKTKKETFDGIKYINDYAVKLNSVRDLTIKRLRYSSENGKKVFGSKPYSLAGEITNLKVNVLNISDEYLNKFLNNEFEGITALEVKEFAKLVNNTSNIGNYGDELDILEKYHKGLRYVINDINISYNKVVRNYNILRSYGIGIMKSLHFAVCYNLVITKEEYQNLMKVLEELGGNA